MIALTAMRVIVPTADGELRLSLDQRRRAVKVEHRSRAGDQQTAQPTYIPVSALDFVMGVSPE